MEGHKTEPIGGRRTVGAELDRCPQFFFQEEDGIRGVAVTGVQTCALPIWLPPEAAITPASPILELRMQLNAPRGLKDPVCCRHSSLKKILASMPKAFSSSAITGVRRTCLAIRRPAS